MASGILKATGQWAEYISKAVPEGTGDALKGGAAFLKNSTFEATLRVYKFAAANTGTAACPAIGAAAVGFAILVVIASAVLRVFGFTAGGIVKGSLAAAWHSTIGNVAASSLFATLQRVGAVTGASVVASRVIAVAGVIVVAAAAVGLLKSSG